MYLEALLGANNGGGSSNTFNTDDFRVVANEVSLTPEQRVFTGTTAEWEALTAEEKALYGTVQLTDDEGTDQKDIYSTSEIKTNKVWIDGKPIYRRIIVKSDANYVTNSWTTVSSESWLANVDNLVTSQVQGKESGKPFVIEGINFHISAGALQYFSFHLFAIDAGSNIILEYTKTTD